MKLDPVMTRATAALIGTVLFAALLFGVPMAISNTHAGRRSEKDTVEYTAYENGRDAFLGGGVIGAVLGVIPGFMIGIYRFKK